MPVGQNEPRQARLGIVAVTLGAQLLSPPHTDAFEELLIVAETRQFFFSQIVQDLRKQHESDRSRTAANEFSQRCQEIWIGKLILLHRKPTSSAKGAPGGAGLGWIHPINSLVAAALLLAAVVIAMAFRVRLGAPPQATSERGQDFAKHGFEGESIQLLVSTDWSNALSSSSSSRSKIQSPFWILVTWSLCSIQPSSSWDTTKWVELYWLMACRSLGKESIDPMGCHGAGVMGGGTRKGIRYFLFIHPGSHVSHRF